MKKHVNIHVSGRVQGVSFRYFILQEALQLNLTGFVRNDPDGTVYIEAEGEKDSIETFINWCHHGPPLARVEKVEVSPAPLKNFPDFSIM